MARNRIRKPEFCSSGLEPASSDSQTISLWICHKQLNISSACRSLSYSLGSSRISRVIILEVIRKLDSLKSSFNLEQKVKAVCFDRWTMEEASFDSTGNL